MLRNHILVITSFFITFLIVASLYTANRVSSAADYVVISEIQIDGESSSDDFIELYNPTSTEIDLANYRLVKVTSSGVSDTNISAFQSGDTIPAHGFFLWCNKKRPLT